jgi:glycerol uptake facilitator-like aquaporin
MHAYMAEFIGTALLILFGNGVVANLGAALAAFAFRILVG